MNTTGKFFGVLALLVVGILSAGLVSAAELEGPFTFDADHNVSIGVEVNDVRLDLNDRKNIEKSEELETLVTFRFTGADAIENLLIEAELTGSGRDRDDIREKSREFTAKPGDVYDEKITLNIPVRTEQDIYSLKIRVESRTESKTFLYDLRIEGDEHALEIRDIVLSPENQVQAGRALLAAVRVLNRGEYDEENVKVKITIDELAGVSGTDYIDEVEAEGYDYDSVTSEEIYLRIPDNAKTGQYAVRATVDFDDGDDFVTKTLPIFIVGSEEAATAVDKPRTIITIGPESATVAQGASAIYPITLTNAGKSAKTYTLVADGAGFATFQITPASVVVVPAGESKVAYVTVSVKSDAVVGDQMFAVTVMSGDEVIKQVPLKAQVVAAEQKAGDAWDSVKKALLIGLIILVVLLVILGLVVGFNKLKEEDDEGKEEGGQTYY